MRDVTPSSAIRDTLIRREEEWKFFLQVLLAKDDEQSCDRLAPLTGHLPFYATIFE